MSSLYISCLLSSWVSLPVVFPFYDSQYALWCASAGTVPLLNSFCPPIHFDQAAGNFWAGDQCQFPGSLCPPGRRDLGTHSRDRTGTLLVEVREAMSKLQLRLTSRHGPSQGAQTLSRIQEPGLLTHRMFGHRMLLSWYVLPRESSQTKGTDLL